MCTWRALKIVLRILEEWKPCNSRRCFNVFRSVLYFLSKKISCDDRVSKNLNRSGLLTLPAGRQAFTFLISQFLKNKTMKKQIKKLSLSKRTISNLKSAEMSRVIGGWATGTCGKTCDCDFANHTKNCTRNQNTCPGHVSCYTC